NEYCGPVESAQHVLVLLRSDQRAHRQRAIELIVIGAGYFFDQLQRLRSERAKQIHLERLAIIRVVKIKRTAAEIPGERLQRPVIAQESLPTLRRTIRLIE